MFAPPPQPRHRGCQRPLSCVQVTVAVYYLLLTGLAYLVIALCASPASQPALYIVQSILCGAALVNYFICSLSDVTAPGGVPCICMSSSQSAPPHYCPHSGTHIPGFDHFCIYMNVAVGRKTYFFFYLLALSGLLQFLWQSTSLALVAAGPWLGPAGSPLPLDSMRAFAGTVAFLSLSGVAAFGSLFLFHSYLLTQGLSTLHWLIRRSEERTGRRSRRVSPIPASMALRAVAPASTAPQLAEEGAAAPVAAQHHLEPSFVTAVSASSSNSDSSSSSSGKSSSNSKSSSSSSSNRGSSSASSGAVGTEMGLEAARQGGARLAAETS